MSEHSEDQAMAIEMIEEDGRCMVMVTETTTGPSYDPTIVEIETPITALQSKFKISEVNGNEVQMSDRNYLMHSEVAPCKGARIHDSGVDYTVMSVEVVAPGDTVVFYKVGARR